MFYLGNKAQCFVCVPDLRVILRAINFKTHHRLSDVTCNFDFTPLRLSSYELSLACISIKGYSLKHGDRCFKSMISWRAVTMQA